jgi:hypothetical protein
MVYSGLEGGGGQRCVIPPAAQVQTDVNLGFRADFTVQTEKQLGELESARKLPVIRTREGDTPDDSIRFQPDGHRALTIDTFKQDIRFNIITAHTGANGIPTDIKKVAGKSKIKPRGIRTGEIDIGDYAIK